MVEDDARDVCAECGCYRMAHHEDDGELICPSPGTRFTRVPPTASVELADELASMLVTASNPKTSMTLGDVGAWMMHNADRFYAALRSSEQTPIDRDAVLEEAEQVFEEHLVDQAARLGVHHRPPESPGMWRDRVRLAAVRALKSTPPSTVAGEREMLALRMEEIATSICGDGEWDQAQRIAFNEAARQIREYDTLAAQRPLPSGDVEGLVARLRGGQDNAAYPRRHYMLEAADALASLSAECERLRGALERCATIVERNLHRQNEKVDDVVQIARTALQGKRDG